MKCLLSFFLFILFFLVVEAQELKTSEQHKGVIELQSGYKVFPIEIDRHK